MKTNIKDNKRHGDLKIITEMCDLSYLTVCRWNSGVEVKWRTEEKIIRTIWELMQIEIKYAQIPTLEQEK